MKILTILCPKMQKSPQVEVQNLKSLRVGRYRTATRLYGYYRLLLDVSSRLDQNVSNAYIQQARPPNSYTLTPSASHRRKTPPDALARPNGTSPPHLGGSELCEPHGSCRGLLPLPPRSFGCEPYALGLPRGARGRSPLLQHSRRLAVAG